MQIVPYFGWVLALPLAAILLYLTLELCVGLLRTTSGPLQAAPLKWTGAILVPAHNEAQGIGATVQALRTAAPQCRIIVVADNCTDRTADLARIAGAEAVIRSDPLRKGKGFALAFGRDYLADLPPDAVIVIDADCRLSPGSADILISSAVQGNRPVQSVNLLVPGTSSSPLVSISNFAMLIKNLVRARGLDRLGGGTLLFGTGMAFPWTLFEGLELATSHAVEDLQLGLSLARQGVRVGFEGKALVTSPAASVSDSKGQRSRWEHGFVGSAVQLGIPLLLAGIRHRSRHLLAIGAHMMVPPLAMLLMLSLVAMFLLMLIFYFVGSVGPLLTLSACLAIMSLALLAAWWIEGRKVLSGRSLLMVPLYMLWKIPIYVGFFTSRQTGWNRTHRDGEQP